MEVFQRAPDPVIVVEVMRRPQTKNATSAPPSVFPTPQVAGGGGLCGPGQGTPADSNSEISSVLSGRRGSATQSVGVQTVLSAGEMAASLAIAAASFAQQEAKMALMGDMNPYCMGVMPGKHPTDYLGISGAGDGAEDEDESEEEGDGEGVDDAVFGAEEVGCLDYILKRYPCNSNGVLPPFTQSNLLPQPIDSVYANFPDNPHSSPGNIVGGEYSSNGSDKCFEVILQKQSVTDKFGLTLCYRPSEVQQNVTEVYISEIEQGSVAHRSGQVMLGDRLLKIGDQEITTREHVVDLFLGCGLCAKITLLRQTPWKVLPGRLQPPYPGNPYPDSTLDIGLTNTAYAHLPDQDSGMGRTTDDSVRTEESSEQEGEEHKLMNSVPVSWPLMDPNAGNLAQAAAFLASGKSHVLDEELIQLSQLMQSLALHCHNLAYVKMCGGLSAEGSLQLPKEGEEGEGVGGVVDATNSPNKTRQTPRMGLGAASSAHKSSSTSGLPPKSGRVPAEPSCDSPAFNGGYYEAVVNPKRPGNPLTLSLSHRQTPSAHLPAPLDLDTSLPQTKCLVSIPATTSTTNPSSIWSIAETDKELPVQQSVRFSVGSPSQFMQQGSRSSHVGSTSSCERQESNASLNDVNVSKPPIQPSVQHQQSQSAGGSLSGSKLSCVSSCSNTSNSRLTRSPVSSTAEHYCPVRGGSGPQEYAFDCLANNPAYMNPIHGAPGMFFPPSFIHPYEFYDRYFKNGLPPPPSTGMLPCFRYPSPQPQTWMYSRKSENDEDKCKDDTASSNIYETPYAAVDVVGPPTKSPDNNSVCFTSYGLLNSASAGQGTTSVGNVSKSIEKPPQNRPLMEWVVKKRTDGTRYITRRPVRNRLLKERAHKLAEERAGLTTDDDGQSDPRGRSGVSPAPVATSSRHHSKGERKRHEPGPDAYRSCSKADRGSSSYRRRTTPTRAEKQPPSTGGLVSLTTV
uniref:PDZ domain-containing protein n=1 Tax=Mesocestoides corti TaxID=53468 RepID=A0A5K3EQA7_MESCO